MVSAPTIMTHRSQGAGQKRRANSPLESSRDKRSKTKSPIVGHVMEEARITKPQLAHEAAGGRQPHYIGEIIDLSKYGSGF